MRFCEIIEKKKRGGTLTREEIKEAIELYTKSEIPDYQMAAFLMAVYFKGMTDEECAALTEAVEHSGDTIDLSFLGKLSADKHSSGGVGDKTTLICAPLAVCLGVKVAKMSGRGLGHTGGTVDKLESIPGFRTSLTSEEFIRQTQKIGIAVVGQTENLAPADKRLYALRDVTATVDSIPLISASIMGKKLASGAKNITLDVKCGSGAFMKTQADAEQLAKSMVRIGRLCGRNTSAYVTDMDFPLGRAIGNTAEVIEAIDVLRGTGDGRLSSLSVALAASMAANTLGGSNDEYIRMAWDAIKSGDALKKFKEWVTYQGADGRYIDSPELFCEAKHKKEVYALNDGYIFACNAELVGLAAMKLGAGRAKKDDPIDMSAAVILDIERGSYVKRGDRIATLYSSVTDDFSSAVDLIQSAYVISDQRPAPVPIILAEF